MANRHLSRSIVMQTLFEWDFSHRDETQLDEIIARNAEEFAPGMGDIEFMKTLLHHVIQKKTELDTIISKAAPEWPIEKISIVDRNILRIGLYELLFAPRTEVPAKVAINEAIELAKTYGGDTSGRFVNGVLGAVYKELGEPGKEETSKRQKFNIPFEKMPIETLCGAVVYALEKDEKGKPTGNIFLALVHDVFGHWTLSKGRTEEGDASLEATAIRELKEEINLDITIKEQIGSNEYVATNPETGKLRKQVTYFLAEAPHTELKLKETGGLDDAQWFKLHDILNLNLYDDIAPILTKAIEILIKQKK